jgi:hypothetical protein
MTISIHLHAWYLDVPEDYYDNEDPVEIDLTDTDRDIYNDHIQIGTEAEAGVVIGGRPCKLEGRIFFHNLPEIIKATIGYTKNEHWKEEDREEAKEALRQIYDLIQATDPS